MLEADGTHSGGTRKHMELQTLDEEAINILARALGIALDPEHLKGVMQNFKTIAAFAAMVCEFPLDEDIESALVYRLCSPAPE